MTLKELEAAKASYKPGQRWEALAPKSSNWFDLRGGEPGWFLDTEYRRREDLE